MEQMATQRTRTISQTTDLEMPVALAVALPVHGEASVTVPVTGVGTFGAWVERHYVAVGLIGMVLSAGILMVPAFAAMTVKLGPVMGLLSWIAGQELAKAEREAEADVAGSLALVALAMTAMAAIFGA